MNATVTLDKAGRFVFPKALRDALHLEPGDTLELEAEGEKVTLRPRRSITPLHKKRGIWVYRTGESLTAETTDQLLREIREERDRRNMGGGE